LFPAAGALDGVLLAWDESGRGPYRGPQNETPVALVPLAPRRARLLPIRRALPATALIACVLVATLLVRAMRGWAVGGW